MNQLPGYTPKASLTSASSQCKTCKYANIIQWFRFIVMQRYKGRMPILNTGLSKASQSTSLDGSQEMSIVYIAPVWRSIMSSPSRFSKLWILTSGHKSGSITKHWPTIVLHFFRPTDWSWKRHKGQIEIIRTYLGLICRHWEGKKFLFHLGLLKWY